MGEGTSEKSVIGKKAVKEETAREELSVIITKRPCVMIVKQTDPPYEISEDCRNCKQCMKIGCPAIEYRDGKPFIITDSCIGCGLCSQVCSFDVIKACRKEAKQ